MYLPNTPTVLEVKHELSHWLDYRRLGVEKYSSLSPLQKEQMVLDRLKSNRSWKDGFNEAEKTFSKMYIINMKADPANKIKPGDPNVK